MGPCLAGPPWGPASGARRTIAIVAYDEELAHRIRALLGSERRVDEKKMFGGLAFLIGGHMTIAVSGGGGVLVRVDPERYELLLRTTKAEAAVMRGRPMRGWLRVSAAHLTTNPQLRKWVELGAGYARMLPAKG